MDRDAECLQLITNRSCQALLASTLDGPSPEWSKGITMTRVNREVKNIPAARYCAIVASLVLICLAVLSPKRTGAGDLKPDPIALLRGVEELRRNCQSGKLEFTVKTTSPTNPKSTSSNTRLVAAFDGANRRYDQFQRIVWTKPGNRHGAENDLQRLNQMGGDVEAFVRAGYGEFENVHIRSCFDGVQFMQYTEKMGAYIRDQKQGTPDFVFDPRILGISINFGINSTIANSLFYEKAMAASLVGREAINGKTTWHAHVLDLNGEDRDYWIQDDDTFHVLKYCKRASYENVETVSTYNEQANWPLPEKVVNREFDMKTGEVTLQTEVTITKADFGTAVDPKLWTLAGLGMPLGKLVIDERIHKVVGYFDGQGLTPDHSGAVKKGREAEKRPLRWVVAVSGLTTLAVVAAVVIKRRGWLRAREA